MLNKIPKRAIFHIATQSALLILSICFSFFICIWMSGENIIKNTPWYYWITQPILFGATLYGCLIPFQITIWFFRKQLSQSDSKNCTPYS